MVSKSFQNGQRGAILLMLLVMVVIMGLAAGIAGQSWRDTMQRAREAELLWRGEQYQKAISSYYSVRNGPRQMLPSKLEDLLRDPRFPNVVRHLRKLYNDPMTNGEWELITDPTQHIIGVRSRSDLEPFRKDGFPESLKNLKGKTSYKEWDFTFVAQKAKTNTLPNQVPGGVPTPAASQTTNPLSGRTSNRVLLPPVPMNPQQ